MAAMRPITSPIVLCACVVCVNVILAAPVAHAKCAFARYRFSIRIVAGPDKTPLTGARVAFFANAATHEMVRRDQSSTLETGDDGRFAAEYWFDTYSGSGIIHADRCKARVKTLEVIVSHPMYGVQRARLRAKELALRPGTDSLTFEAVLPTMTMDGIQ
jgi:hypothetical protein